MISGIFKLTNFPDLSQNLELNFEFASFTSISGSLGGGNSESYNKLIVSADEQAIYYNEDVAFSEGKWAHFALRSIIVPEQDFEGEEWIINNQMRTVENQDKISYTVVGPNGEEETFSIVRNSTWSQAVLEDGSAWTLTTKREIAFLSEVGFLVLYYNGRAVSIDDPIVPNGRYIVPSQININMVISDDGKVWPNPNALVGTGILGTTIPQINLQSKERKVVDLIGDNAYVSDKAKRNVEPYVSIEIKNNKLILTADEFPEHYYNCVDYELPIGHESTLIPVQSIEVFNDADTKLTELLPPYRMHIKGQYCTGEENGIEATLKDGDGIKLMGVGCSDFLFSFLSELGETVTSGTVVPVSYITAMFSFFGNFPVFSLPASENFYMFGSSFIDYLNEKIPFDELLGFPVLALVYEEESLIEYIIKQFATEAGLSIEEYKLQLQEEAETAGLSLNEYVKLIYEQDADSKFEELRWLVSAVISEELAEAAKEIKDKATQHVPFSIRGLLDGMINSMSSSGSASLDAFYSELDFVVLLENPEGKTLEYEYKMVDTRKFALKNNGVEVRNRICFSEENDFAFTETNLAGDGGTIVIDSIYAPTQRNVPGVLTTINKNMACLSGDTLITLANGEKIRIDQIKIGDYVLTTNGPEKIVFSDANLHKIAKKYIIYTFANDQEIKVIKDHRIYSCDRNAFVHFSKLKLGEKCLGENGEITYLKEKRLVNEKINHYTLYTKNSNAYYANGLVCGNFFSNIRPNWIRKLGVNLYIFLVSWRSKS